MSTDTPAPSIPIEECTHGHLYRIHSRNLTVGIYRSDVKGFVGIREKFGPEDRFLFTEYHFDTGPPHGTAHPKEDLGPSSVEDFMEGEFRDGQWQENEELFTWLDGVQHSGLS